MAATLLEFGWALRRHTEAGVRRAVLRGTALALLAAPGEWLAENQAEAAAWLGTVVEDDPDPDCRSIAQWCVTNIFR